MPKRSGFYIFTIGAAVVTAAFYFSRELPEPAKRQTVALPSSSPTVAIVDFTEIRRLILERKFQEAISSMGETDDPSLLSLKSLAIEGSAWNLIQNGQCDQATSLLVKIPNRGLDRSQAQKAWAFCFLKNEDFSHAEESAIRAITLNPSDSELYLLLASIYEPMDRLSDMAPIINSAPEIKDEGFLRLRSRVLSEVSRSPKVNQIEGRYVRISYPEELDSRFVQSIVDSADAFVQQLNSLFGGKDDELMIPIVLYESKYWRTSFDNLPMWVDGFFDGKIRVPIQSLSKSSPVQRLLRHELVHGYIALSWKIELPIWLDEGLAETLSQEQRAFERSPHQSANFLPRTAFEAKKLGSDALKVKDFYRQSQFLVERIGGLAGSQFYEKLREVLQKTSVLSSDIVTLATTGQTFDQVYLGCKDEWNGRSKL